VTSLPDRFRSWVGRRPSAPAVRTTTEELSYAEVDRRSDDVARMLADAGVPAGTAVGLSASRGAHVPIAILGVLKHGCAYVPFDPAYPAERARYPREDVGLRWLLTEEPPRGPGLRLKRIEDNPAAELELPPGTAYVIYTSGSTGRPKGVLVRHSHVLSLIRGAEAHFGFSPDDVWTLYHSHCFDLSVWEIWGAWCTGGAVLTVPTGFVRTASMLAELLDRRGASVLTLVPTAFHHLVQALERQPRRLPRLREVVLAGEPIKIDVVDRWRALGPGPARVVNMYGITEITVHATFCDLPDPLTARFPGTTPIGRPLPHLDLHVLAEDGTAAAPGVPGELLVVGDAVADGYARNPEATALRFRQGPDGRPAYLSGDFAIRDEEGGLHFLGRRDDQVQIKGYRIEPAEVAAAVESHPDVVACVVTTPAADGGERYLVAHCVSPGAALDAPVTALRKHVAEILPSYLMPTDFVVHESFPVTANGKVDRAALDAGWAARTGSRDEPST
jgi:amino acid adenylation domain-containing protein